MMTRMKDLSNSLDTVTGNKERCRCGQCGRFIGHMSQDDHSCARCCNFPVLKEDGPEWQPKICPPCIQILKDDYC